MSGTRLIIARHGETEYNKKGLMQGRKIDAPLNNRGWEQARSLAGYLNKNYQADALVCSSLLRSFQTAEPYRETSGLEILKNPELDEMDFGRFEGKPCTQASRELHKLHAQWQQGNVDRPVPGGESPKEVYNRANRSVQALLNSFNGNTLILILHGRLIRVLLSEWLGYGLPNMHKIEHQNGSVNHLVYDGQFKPVYLNKTAHLPV